MAQRLQITYDIFRGMCYLSDEDLGKLFRGIGESIYEGKKIDLPDKLMGSYYIIKPYLDDDIERHRKYIEAKSENGSKGGRPEKNWDKSQKAKKAKKAKKATDIDNDIDNENIYINNIDVNKIFIEYLEMRKEIKKPIKTKISLDMIIKELEKYDDPTKIKMIEKSIMNNRQGIFPIKELESTKDYTKLNNFHEMMMKDKVPELKQVLGIDKFFEIKNLWKKSPLYLSF